MSGGILLAGLGTGLVASYRGAPPDASGVRGAPAELAYVSADAEIVAFAAVREMKGSAFHEALGSFGAAGEPGRLEAETGINIERDVDRLLATMAPGGAGSREGRPLLLARGRFDRDRVESLVRAQGGALEEYRGRRLLAHKVANIGLAFIEPDLVALGTPCDVRRALDVRHGAQAGIRSNAELMRQVRDVHNGHAWAVVRGSAMSRLHSGMGFPPGMTDATRLPAFSWLVASGEVDGSIRGHLRAEALDDAGARELREAIRGAMAMGRRQADRHPEWSDFIDSLELGGHGRAVSVGFAIPAGMVQSLRRAPRPLAPPAVQPPLEPHRFQRPQAPRGIERRRPHAPRSAPARVAGAAPRV